MKTISPEMMILVRAVKDLAKEKYNLGYGWQVIIECMTDEEVAEDLKEEEITTKEAAIKHFTWVAELHNEREQEIMSTVW